MKRKVILTVALLLAFFPLTVLASSSSWWAYGKNQQRTHEATAQHTQPPLFLKWKVPHIGWSISQPIVANGFIFHQAGGYLYKIPLNLPFVGGEKSVWWLLNHGASRIKVSNNYNARSHPVYNRKTHVIYVGTGDYRIRKIDPFNLEIKESYIGGGRLVDSPTILGKDLVAYGNSNAEIYIFKGIHRNVIHLAAPSSRLVITGTFGVKSKKHPIIFIPINYQGINRPGYVDAYQVIDHGSGHAPTIRYIWPRPFIADNGVPTSTVYDKQTDRVYFTDKSGAVYAINAKTGRLVWKNTKFQSASDITTLVNNSPALSGHILVVPYRYYHGRGHGMIAAFNTNNGHLIWARTSAGEPLSSGKYDGEVACDPVVDTDGDQNALVMIGTTNGDLRAFQLKTGARHFITKAGGKSQTVLHAVSGGKGSIYQGQGLATEITVADGHIIFGANRSASPNASGTNGTLYAYSTPWAYSSGVTDLSGRLGVPQKVKQGLPLRVFATPTNIGTSNVDKPFDTKLYVNGVLVSKRKFTGLKAGKEQGAWVKVPPVFATNHLGISRVKLVVDSEDNVKEAVEQNNTILRTYQVVTAPATKCPKGGKWNKQMCIRKWTEHHVYHHRTKSVLIQ